MKDNDGNPFAPSEYEDMGSIGGGPTGEHVYTELTIRAIITKSWDLFIENIGLILGPIAVIFAISLGFGLVGGVFDVVAQEMEPQEALIVTLISLPIDILSYIVQIWLNLGFIHIGLNVLRGQPVEFTALFGQGHRLLTAILAGILIGLAVMTGCLLMIVPGVIAALGFAMAQFLIVDQRLGVMDALSESWRLMDGEKAFLFLFQLVVGFGVLAFGLITCGLGLLIAAPALALTNLIIYDSLVSLKGDHKNPKESFGV